MPKIKRPTRSKTIIVRLLPEEDTQIRSVAETYKMTASDFIRTRALSEPSINQIEEEIQRRTQERLRDIEFRFEREKQKYLDLEIASMSVISFLSRKGDIKRKIKLLGNK